jgi:hypothetical protein
MDEAFVEIQAGHRTTYFFIVFTNLYRYILTFPVADAMNRDSKSLKQSREINRNIFKNLFVSS